MVFTANDLKLSKPWRTLLFHLNNKTISSCAPLRTVQNLCYVLFANTIATDAAPEFQKFLTCLLVLSADNICKEFGPRSGSELFATLIVILKEFLKKKMILKNNQTDDQKHEKFPRRRHCSSTYMWSGFLAT